VSDERGGDGRDAGAEGEDEDDAGADGSDGEGSPRESRADRLRRRRGAQRERVEEFSDVGTGEDEEPPEAAADDAASDRTVTGDVAMRDAATGSAGQGQRSAVDGDAPTRTDESTATDGSATVDGDDGGSDIDASTGSDERLGTSVKEEQVGTYMYLPESQKKEVERRYTVLKAEFEYEFERDFEKNRHFFPLLVEHGLSGLDEADAEDVRGMLESLDR
jgi:hypothetical protein